MSSVFLVGAHGHIGQQIVEDLANKGVTVFAGIRDLSQVDVFPDSPFIHPTQFDLNALPDKMAEQFKASGADTIVFSAGSGGKTGDDQTLIVDLDGAVKTMEAAEQADIKRYIMVSSIFSNRRETWDASGIKPYMIAKRYADEMLKQTSLDYTIIRPGYLTNEAGTGEISVNPANEQGLKIPRADVAATITELIDAPDTIRKAYTIGTGETPIDQAF
ncbi:MAG TPA: NAD(P)-dependent oxidoreductase [Lactobacillus sp.]|nr:NAD(P)-dependent oxidoreductase [Lactobacillus sp.]